MKHDLTYTSCLPGKDRKIKKGGEGGAERFAMWPKHYLHDLQCCVVLSLPTFSSSLMNYKTKFLHLMMLSPTQVSPENASAISVRTTYLDVSFFVDKYL